MPTSALDVAHVPAVRLTDGEVSPDQVRILASALVRDRGLHPPAQPDPREPVLPHDPGDALVIHPGCGRHAVVEVGGEPGRPVGAVTALGGVLQHTDPISESSIFGYFAA